MKLITADTPNRPLALGEHVVSIHGGDRLPTRRTVYRCVGYAWLVGRECALLEVVETVTLTKGI